MVELADMTLMFDNSRSEAKAFSLVYAQRGKELLFDCRDERFQVQAALRGVANLWLPKVVGAAPRG